MEDGIRMIVKQRGVSAKDVYFLSNGDFPISVFLSEQQTGQALWFLIQDLLHVSGKFVKPEAKVRTLNTEPLRILHNVNCMKSTSVSEVNISAQKRSLN